MSAPFRHLRRPVRLRSRSSARKPPLAEASRPDTEPIRADTRIFVWQRDGGTCRHCGSRHDLHFDHVIPRSKGGGSTWENIVTCCAPCNRRKGDRLPKQADMHPRQQPKPPPATIFVHVATQRVPDQWQQYLPV